MELAIEAIGLQKTYAGGVGAVKGIDLEVAPGEVFGLLGPNGAGKSTTVGMLTTTIVPTSGGAKLAGFDVAAEPLAARAASSVVFQEPVVDGALTGWQNLELHARLWGVEPREAKARIDELATTLGLTDLVGRAVGSYSGGERRRLEIARAMSSKPQVLFLDEPTVGLDPRIRHELLDVIAGLRAREDMTIVLTTHYLEEADQLAHRIVVIDHGIVIADATPREIKARIPSKRVNFTSETAVDEAPFSGLPVQHLEIAAGRVHLLSNEPEVVLRGLFERGVAVRDLEVTGADLEEAFLSMTRRA